MSRRRLVLEEMGIAPLWRLRSPPVAADAGAPADASVAGPADVPVPLALLEEAGPVPPASTRAPVESRRGSVARVSEAKTSDAPAVAGEADERRRQILGMDWTALKAAVAQCVACPLHAKRTNTVFGVGDEGADWLFVGEGPGAEEDAKGEPFVGQAGRLLDNMLAAIGMRRGENVYIANVVKCRPPGNRNPEPGEMRCCEPYLTRQIALIQPKLIIAMGRIAASHLLATDASIASLRGRVHDYQGTPLIVTYHPAYLLRTMQDKAKSWADLCFARETMTRLRGQAEA